MAKFCSNCGKTVDENVAYCEGCGNALNINSSLQHETKNIIKGKYGLPLLINGALAIILGFIGMIYNSKTLIGGVAVGFLQDEATFSQQARKEYIAYMARENAADRLWWLVGFGILLIVTGIIAFAIKSNRDNKNIKTVLWLVPMSIILLFAIINYIPIFSFVSIYS